MVHCWLSRSCWFCCAAKHLGLSINYNFLCFVFFSGFFKRSSHFSGNRGREWAQGGLDCRAHEPGRGKPEPSLLFTLLSRIYTVISSLLFSRFVLSAYERRSRITGSLLAPLQHSSHATFITWRSNLEGCTGVRKFCRAEWRQWSINSTGSAAYSSTTQSLLVTFFAPWTIQSQILPRNSIVGCTLMVLDASVRIIFNAGRRVGLSSMHLYEVSALVFSKDCLLFHTVASGIVFYFIRLYLRLSFIWQGYISDCILFQEVAAQIAFYFIRLHLRLHFIL